MPPRPNELPLSLVIPAALPRHSRAGGNLDYLHLHLDSRLRGNDMDYLDSRLRGNDMDMDYLDSRRRGNDVDDIGWAGITRRMGNFEIRLPSPQAGTAFPGPTRPTLEQTVRCIQPARLPQPRLTRCQGNRYLGTSEIFFCRTHPGDLNDRPQAATDQRTHPYIPTPCYFRRWPATGRHYSRRGPRTGPHRRPGPGRGCPHGRPAGLPGDGFWEIQIPAKKTPQ